LILAKNNNNNYFLFYIEINIIVSMSRMFTQKKSHVSLTRVEMWRRRGALVGVPNYVTLVGPRIAW